VRNEERGGETQWGEKRKGKAKKGLYEREKRLASSLEETIKGKIGTEGEGARNLSVCIFRGPWVSKKSRARVVQKKKLRGRGDANLAWIQLTKNERG